MIAKPGRASVRRCTIGIPPDVEMGTTFVQGEGNRMSKGREVGLPILTALPCFQDSVSGSTSRSLMPYFP